MSSAKKTAEQPVAAEGTTLEQLVLDKKEGKYGVVALISFWAKELRKQEEHRHLTQTDILEKAMQEVLAGKVSLKELEKRMLEGGAAEEPEKKSAEKPSKESAKDKKD